MAKQRDNNPSPWPGDPKQFTHADGYLGVVVAVEHFEFENFSGSSFAIRFVSDKIKPRGICLRTRLATDIKCRELVAIDKNGGDVSLTNQRRQKHEATLISGSIFDLTDDAGQKIQKKKRKKKKRKPK